MVRRAAKSKREPIVVGDIHLRMNHRGGDVAFEGCSARQSPRNAISAVIANTRASRDSPPIHRRRPRMAAQTPDSLITSGRFSLPFGVRITTILLEFTAISAIVKRRLAGVAQLAERQPSKLNVEGSTPFARFEFPSKSLLFNNQLDGPLYVLPLFYFRHFFSCDCRQKLRICFSIFVRSIRR